MTTKFPGAIVITGAGGGLGSALAKGLLEAGVRDLVCHYRSSEQAAAAVLLEAGLDPKRHLVQADLTDEQAVQAMHRQVSERFGPVWGLINMAGTSSNGMSWKLSLEEFKTALESHLVSTFLTTKEFLPEMRQQGGGRIINISSVIAHTGVPGASHYCAAKAAIEGFSRAVALETAQKNVTVNCLALGYFDKGIIATIPPPLLEAIVARVPQKRLGPSRELAPLAQFLLGESSSFITGQVIHVNGGLRT
jgi:NAD(P)-dependent dehydrogenase (short-subunit alcohol dehydrogenase family)